MSSEQHLSSKDMVIDPEHLRRQRSEFLRKVAPVSPATTNRCSVKEAPAQMKNPVPMDNVPSSASNHSRDRKAPNSPRLNVAIPQTTTPHSSHGAPKDPTAAHSSRMLDNTIEEGHSLSNAFIDVLTVAPSPRTSDVAIGLRNNGGQCYFNAVITAILSSDCFLRYVRDWYEPYEQRRYLHLGKDSLLFWLASYYRILDSQPHSNEKAVENLSSCKDRMWSCICYPKLDYTNDHDCHLQHLPWGSWKDFIASENESSQQDPSDLLQWLLLSARDQFADNTQAIAQFNWVTRPLLSRRIRCSQCRASQQRHSDGNPLLTLDLPSQQQDSSVSMSQGQSSHQMQDLSQVLRARMQETACSGKCPSCNMMTSYTVCLQFQHCPGILGIKLRRAKVDDFKDMSSVQIPEYLDVSEWLDPDDLSSSSCVRYRLIAVVAHRGRSISAGHYVSYVRSGQLRTEWSLLDDDKVSPAQVLGDFNDSKASSMSDNEFGNRPTPYILLYDQEFQTDVTDLKLRAHMSTAGGLGILERASRTDDRSAIPTNGFSNQIPSSPITSLQKENVLGKPGHSVEAGERSKSSGQDIAEEHAKYSGIRVSVGDAFELPRSPQQSFIDAVRTDDQLTWRTPIGFRNREPQENGSPIILNLCYRNAVLSMLLSSQRFLAYLLWHCPEEFLKNLALRENDSHILELLRQVRWQQSSDWANDALASLWLKVCTPSTGTPEVPGTYQQSRWGDSLLNSSFDDVHGVPLQQDAGEFLGRLLTTINAQLVHAGLGDCQHLSNSLPTNPHWAWLIQCSTTHRFSCEKCQYKVANRKSGSNGGWALPLTVNETSDEINNALSRLRSPGNLTDLLGQSLKEPADVARQCCRCQSVNTHGLSFSRLLRTPEVLLIALNRYGYNAASSYKKFKSYEISSVLDVSPWLEPHQYGEGSQVLYNLAAIVSHRGESLDEGHYIAFVRGGENRSKWYCVNDEIVTEVDIQNFNDSRTSNMTKSKFCSRFTPVILLYEIDHKHSVLLPGRAAVNINQGASTDEVPTQLWYQNPPAGESARFYPTMPRPQLATVQAANEGHEIVGPRTGQARSLSSDANGPDHNPKQHEKSTVGAENDNNEITHPYTDLPICPASDTKATDQYTKQHESSNVGTGNDGEMIADLTTDQPRSLTADADGPDHNKTQHHPSTADEDASPASGRLANTELGNTDTPTQTVQPPSNQQVTNPEVSSTNQQSALETIPMTTTPSSMNRSAPAIETAGPIAWHAFPSDQGWPSAELNISVTIGDQRLELPKIEIDRFNRTKKRKIEIDANLTAAKKKRHDPAQAGTARELVNMDLMCAYIDAEEAARRTKASKLKAPPKPWKDYWADE